MTNAETGTRIKYARGLRNATLDEVARKVGVTKSTIQRYENGKINAIKIPVVESIAAALQVNPAWLLGKSDDMELPVQKLPGIMRYYSMLNETGRQEAEKRVEELTHIPRYALCIRAAHNYYAADPEELERMREDLSTLQWPDSRIYD